MKISKQSKIQLETALKNLSWSHQRLSTAIDCLQYIQRDIDDDNIFKLFHQSVCSLIDSFGENGSNISIIQDILEENKMIGGSK